MKSYDSYVLFAALVFLLPALPFALIAWFNASRAASQRRRAETLSAYRAANRRRADTQPRKPFPAKAKKTRTAAKQPPATQTAQRPEILSDPAKPFAGETVAFTGSCPKLERRAMMLHTQRLGGRAFPKINTRCTLLVVGEDAGQYQLERAAKWHIKTITWQEWFTRTFGKDALPAPQKVQGMTLDDFAAMLPAD